MFLLEAAAAVNANQAATGTISVGADLMKLLTQVNWSSPTWDLFIILFFVITVFLYGMSLGRDRIVVILVSIYMALAVVSNAPFLAHLNASVKIGDFFAFKITAFLGLFVLLFFLLSRSALLHTFGNLASGNWLQVMIFSTLHVGLLVSITLSFLPKEAVGHLAPMTREIFASETARFAWIVAPIVAMAVLRGEQRRA